MSTTLNKPLLKGIPGRFDDLVGILPPRVIHDESDYDNVIEFIGAILARPRRTKGQDEYVATWAILIEAYEDERHAIDDASVSGLDALKVLIEQHGMNASDLGRVLGNASLGGKILRGDRQLSKANMRALATHFHVEPALFF